MKRDVGSATLVAVGLLAGSVLLFEIALTRVFAIMLWHHLAYMVVSIAMLGFGAAGSLLTSFGRRDGDGDVHGSLALFSGLYALAVPASLFLASAVEVDSLRLLEEPRNAAGLLLLYAIVTLPLLLAGLAIGIALSRFPGQVPRIYFADLVGSALGGALAVPLLGGVGNVPTAVLAGAAGAVAAFLFAMRARPRSLVLALAILVGMVFLATGFLGGDRRIGVPALEWSVPFAAGKELDDDTPLSSRIPSATAEVQVREADLRPPMIGGDFGVLDRRLVPGRFVAQDGTAPTMLFENAADVERFEFLDDSQTSSSYVVLGERGVAAHEVLVIGVGGGVDVMVALAHGARKITAVEVNAAMVRMVEEDYADYLGGLFDPEGPHGDRVRLVHGEGRSFLRRGEQRFDAVQMSGVDSFTALSTGAYSLSESFLYTVEAMKDAWNRLSDDGVLNCSRFILDHPRLPRESLRLANVVRTALEELGVPNPERHVAVFRGRLWASTMVSRRPFTTEEVAALRRFAEAEGFHGLVYDPSEAERKSFDPRPEPGGIVASYFRDWLLQLTSTMVTPVDVDRATTLMTAAYSARFRGLDDEQARLLKEAVELFPVSLRPKAWASMDATIDEIIAATTPAAEARARARADFHTILAGTPGQRASLIARYPFDLSACTDDTPFFFNYYRWDALFEGAALGDDRDPLARRYHPEFPVGHAVLAASLVQIVLLAALLIFLPLRRLKRRGESAPGAWRYLVYFAALGFGFMAIEIVLLQRGILFLGHPTHAMSVVLTVMLAAAGVGALLSGRFRDLGRRTLATVLGLILAALAFQEIAYRGIVPVALGWPIGVRIALEVLMLTPVGLALGLAFPTGLRILETNARALVPWAWAVNGFTSVLGSIGVIVIAREVGFSRALLVSAAIYVVGFLFMIPGPRPARRLEPATAPADEEDDGEPTGV